MKLEDLLKLTDADIDALALVDNHPTDTGCFECEECYFCDHCVECIKCNTCSRCKDCWKCVQCRHCYYCAACVGCQDCVDCDGLVNAQYVIGGRQFTAARYWLAITLL
jgi:hypothetical protein